MEKNFKNHIFIDKINYVTKKKSSKCIFCDLELVKDTLLKEFDDFIIILNKYPYNPGHLMIVPKKHVEDIDDLTENEFLILFSLLKLVKKILKEVYNPQAFNIGINLGKAAGGSVKHLHVHVVPRYSNELNFLEVTSGTRIIVEPLESTINKLRAAFNKK
ncbi:MAG: HIT family protein [Candidatus Helarchaeota archaeon]